MTHLLISFLTNRLRTPKLGEQDFVYYMEQFSSDDDEPSNFNPDKAILHQILR